MQKAVADALTATHRARPVERLRRRVCTTTRASSHRATRTASSPTASSDRRRARHPRQPALLPGHAAVGLRRHRRATSARSASTDEHRGGGWSRIVIEKPFGHDLTSARALNRDVLRVFDESQVYRIDHYLGKETVRNLLVFRFGNGIFEPVWNRRYIDHVQITVAEDLGVEGRGAFYEEAGATRDILQNHVLQLLSLVAMEPPIAFEADALRDEKVRVLRAIDPDWTVDRVRRDVVRGQYAAGWVGGRAGAGLPRRARGRGGLADRDLRRPAPRGPELALGRRALLPADRQAPAQAGVRDRHPVQAAATDALPRRDDRSRRRTCSRCASSPTRASCCASRPRCPSSAWTCAA